MGRLFLSVAIACAGMLLFGSMVVAQNSNRVPAEQKTTEQKALFVGNLVLNSVTVRTIEAKGDQAAKSKLVEARGLVKQAKDDLKKGDYKTADKKLDEALRLVNSEARKLSERDLKQKRQAEAYEKRRNAVQIFLDAYERVATEKGLSTTTAGHVATIRDLLAEAEALSRTGKTSEANAVLDRAYVAARGDIRQMRDGETLTRTLNFKTPQEEYSYEKDRNDSHIMLLKFAITEKAPPETRRARIDALNEKALALRARAEQEAKSRNHVGAIGTLVESTDVLLKAIRMSGIWIPG